MCIRAITYLVLFLLVSINLAEGVELQVVLDRHAEALGGRERIAAISSMQVESSISLGGMTGRSVSYYQAPDRVRVELELPVMSYLQVCNGDDCWMSDRRGLVSTLTAEFKGMLVTQQILERHLYLEADEFPGEITLIDTFAVVGNRKCYLVDLHPELGAPAQLLIDRESFLLQQVNIETDLVRVQTTLADYRQVSGVMIPFKAVEQTDAGFVAAEITVSAIEINPELPDSLFERPTPVVVDSGNEFDSVVVPFELFNNHIYVELLIGGQGPYSFIFDSGAGGMAIGSRLAEQLELVSLGRAEARGVGGADSAGVFSLPRVQIGDLELDSLTAFGLQLASLERKLEHSLAGIIGYELLSRFTVSVDYDSRLLTFYPSNTEPRPDWGEACTLLLDFRLPYMELTVNDSITGRFRVDTGSRSTLDLNSPFVAEHQLLDTTRQNFLRYDIYGLGGSSTGFVSMLPSLTLCGDRLDSLFVGYSQSSEGLFAGAATAGNLGGGILKRFRVTFDYHDEQIYLRKSAAAEKLGRIRNMAGLRIVAKSEEFVVVEVFADGPAAGKIEIGDQLLRINGQPLEALNLEDVNWMLIDARGRQVEIEFTREGKQLSETILLQSLY